MAVQSQYFKVPKKILYYISQKIITDKFDSYNPYEDFEGNYKILKNVSKFFNINTHTIEDVEFFAKFIEVNEGTIIDITDGDKSLINDLEIPVAKTFRLYYNTYGSCTYTEYKYQDSDSYDIEWVIRSTRQQEFDGDWNSYDGVDRRQTDYENFEENSCNFENVIELSDSKKQNESLLSKLVLENTQDVVKSLDKETLVRLKTIIDSRLSHL